MCLIFSWSRFAQFCIVAIALQCQLVFANEEEISSFREKQVRQFKNTTAVAAANAILETLDSLGFSTISHDPNSGTVVTIAYKSQPVKYGSTIAGMTLGALANTIPVSRKAAVTVTYEQKEQSMEIHVDYQGVFFNRSGAIVRTMRLSDPSIYADFFASLSKLGGLELAQ